MRIPVGPMVRRVLAGLVMAVAAGIAAPPRQGPASVTAHLQELLSAEVRDHPSLPGELLHVHVPAVRLDVSLAAGIRDRESKRALHPGDLFRVASVTKTFTAASVLRLVEDGTLKLDESIDAHLSAESLAVLRAGGYSTGAIRVRHLLTHTSGIYDYATDARYYEAVLSDPTRQWTRAGQVAAAMEWGSPRFEPGTGYHYSDTGYVLLGEVLERRSEKTLAQAYRTMLEFERLGLRATYLETLEPPPPHTRGISHPYFGNLDTIGFHPSFDLYGGGGLVSSVQDLARFYRALLTGKVYRQKSTLQTMLDVPETNEGAAGGPYAMGIQHRMIAGESCWGHTGFWGTSAFHCPQADLTIVRHYNQAQPEEAFVFNRLFEQIAELLRLKPRSP